MLKDYRTARKMIRHGINDTTSTVKMQLILLKPPNGQRQPPTAAAHAFRAAGGGRLVG
jgi:hypothetical protein